LDKSKEWHESCSQSINNNSYLNLKEKESKFYIAVLVKREVFKTSLFTLFARHAWRADGLKETLSPNQREDNP